MDRRRIFRIGLALLGALASLNDLRAETPAERYMIEDPTGSPIEIGVWAPSGEAEGRPLILISHGSGGDYRSHVDTAEALAEAGFVVAALTHGGDNWRDMSRVAAIWERPRQLHLLADHMLGAWRGRGRIDPARIGAFGFSAGGFTVLVAAGGRPDLGLIPAHCRDHPDFFDCRIAAAAGGARLAGAAARLVDWTHDERLGAVVVAAPALGFAFGRDGLAGVRAPVQLWSGDNDAVLPHPFYAEAVRAALPSPPDYRLVPDAGHFDFLAPCAAPLAAARPELCSSAPGFDRAAFHREFNAALVAFFRRMLAVG